MTLDKLPFYHCQSAEFFEKKVKSSSSQEEYIVRFDKFSHKNRNVIFDYSCNCVAYRMGRGKYCKHIEQAKKDHCNWSQFVNGGDVIEKDGKKFCPKCLSEIKVSMWGV